MDVSCCKDLADALVLLQLDRLGTQGFIDRLKDRVNGTRVYVTVDIDSLDPAFAPATGKSLRLGEMDGLAYVNIGTAEPGGWTTRELLTILDGLSGLEVVGADVVEVAPVSFEAIAYSRETAAS